MSHRGSATPSPGPGHARPNRRAGCGQRARHGRRGRPFLEAGHRRLYADRHRIELKPRPRRSCPDCRGAGGWWTSGPFLEMEACGCWSERRELRVRLLPVAAWDEPPF
ncbi:hypothetical protein N4G70_35970 [Streptomyces sp. ASQP_92]|uniref:hypothetical protein n=1 Tax=Streptomyces sp. ASQP_92 TaxID=2979116 RepID=UPI0021C17867|nr:hypothetical protein [Streptomyces sp. ASQP_92]MCT9094199.1 hypothetical protein [Streptomyces sp. ASQP_92]